MSRNAHSKNEEICSKLEQLITQPKRKLKALFLCSVSHKGILKNNDIKNFISNRDRISYMNDILCPLIRNDANAKENNRKLT